MVSSEAQHPPKKQSTAQSGAKTSALLITPLRAKYYHNIDERGEWYSGEATYITQIDRAEWGEDERSLKKRAGAYSLYVTAL